jgi:hypothetical protein
MSSVIIGVVIITGATEALAEANLPSFRVR